MSFFSKTKKLFYDYKPWTFMDIEKSYELEAKGNLENFSLDHVFRECLLMSSKPMAIYVGEKLKDAVFKRDWSCDTEIKFLRRFKFKKNDQLFEGKQYRYNQTDSFLSVDTNVLVFDCDCPLFRDYIHVVNVFSYAVFLSSAKMETENTSRLWHKTLWHRTIDSRHVASF